MNISRGKIASFLIAFSLAVGCTNAEFGGAPARNSEDATARPGDNLDPDKPAKGLGRPDDFTDDLLDSGWINNQSFDDFDNEFDTAGNAGNGAGGDEGIFTDPTGALQTGQGATYAYWQPCDENSFVTEAETGFAGPDGTYVRVSGSFCPKGAGELTALFVVDFSGSMESQSVFGAVGNDPRVGGGCGRLDATRAILEKLLDEAPKGATIRAGILGFSDNADMRLRIRDAEDLLDDIDANKLCGADSDNAFTNYQAAFRTAQDVLEEADGNKVVYFISDGAPTRDSGGIDAKETRARQSGLDAARDFKDAFDDLTLEVIFLGNIEDQNLSEQYLEDLAGDPDNVTLVSNAADLGEAAAAIDVPGIGMKKSSFSATVTYADGRKTNVELDKVGSSKQFGTTFMTKPFPLKGPKGSKAQHELVVEAKTEEGDRLKSIVTLDFRAQ